MEKQSPIAPLMEKQSPTSPPKRNQRLDEGTRHKLVTLCIMGAFTLWLLLGSSPVELRPSINSKCTGKGSPYGQFPKADDPFSFVPCTNTTAQPPLDDPEPARTWAEAFDPNPDHWIWGSSTLKTSPGSNSDPFSGRGIYLCGYLDVPLDYTNTSDPRIVRLAITKFQVSGLAHVGHQSAPSAGHKSARTIVIEPGGPGGSGTSYAFRAAEKVTQRLSDGQFDVLGWDPRGVNMSQPALSCVPYDADRDRWSLLTSQGRREVGSTKVQLRHLEAMADAKFRACLEIHGDFPRFVSTAFVVRDMEQIRKALGEDELTGYLVSYGTNIGQTYANMFPEHVGRIILDGVVNIRRESELGGFGWSGLDNITDAWNEGFLGECIDAGPEHCVLAKLIEADGREDSASALSKLRHRMETMITSLIEHPIPGYTKSSGPSLITYSTIIPAIFISLYNPRTWPALAQMLYDLDAGNATLAAEFMNHNIWEYDPSITPVPSTSRKPRWDELASMVVCSEEYDAEYPSDPIDFYDAFWANMTQKAWIGGDLNLFIIFPCHRFGKYWTPAEVYRGPLNNTLKNPVLLISETHDPATPLRNGRQLLADMEGNARMIVHHGYGHSSADTSKCTDEKARAFILDGVVSWEGETACFADEKPFRYEGEVKSHVEVWREHLVDMALRGSRIV